MAVYSAERKAAILSKLLPPYNLTLAALSRQEGVSKSALYEWRKQLEKEGKAVPVRGCKPEPPKIPSTVLAG